MARFVDETSRIQHVTADTPIVLIHGLWMTALSWERWTEDYSNRGYNVVARSWPGMEGDMEILRRDPGSIYKVGLDEIV